MSHNHHIVPKYAGGTDEPDNLIRLSVEAHAKAHQLLYEQYGHWQDYVAWQGLASLIDKETLVKLVQSNAAKDRLVKYGNPFAGIRTRTNFKDNPEHQLRVNTLSKTQTSVRKRKETFKKIKHQQADTNSQFGTVWCVKQDAVDLNNRVKFYKDSIPTSDWITTTEWVDRRKNKKSNAYGRHWYNDGNSNFYLKPINPKINELKLIRGRLIKQ